MNKQGPNKIEYLDYTWGPVSGCLHGCEYCYMKRMARRFPDKISMVPAVHYRRLEEPLKIKKPALIGVTFCGDMWGAWVQKAWIEYVLETCRKASWHRFLFLTKNPARYGEFEIPVNCWCGVSVTGERTEGGDNNGRIGMLLDIFSERRFVSIEPFIGDTLPVLAFNTDWIIVGGLTGKNTRKPNESLMWAVVELCKEWKRPLFIKTNAGYPEVVQEYPEGLILK